MRLGLGGGAGWVEEPGHHSFGPSKYGQANE